MRGIILAYSDDVTAGVIRNNDGRLHSFSRRDWISEDYSPKKGLDVTFQIGPQRVSQVRTTDKGGDLEGLAGI